MNLQRMIVIPGHTFEKWKNIIIQDDKMSELDKNMKVILHNSKLDDMSKWHLYRQNLIHFSNSKRSFDKNVSKRLPIRSVMKDVSTEAKVFKRSKDVQTEKMGQDVETQFNEEPWEVMKVNKLSPIKPINEIFETSNKFASLDEEDFKDQTENDIDDNELFDQDENTKRLALEGLPKDAKIVRERKSLKPNEYRVFELNTGENVNVPVINEKRITRARAQKLKFDKPDPPRKNKTPSSSTPSKKKQGGRGLGNNFKTYIPWIAYK